MPIIHIVLFEFKPSASQSQVQDVCERMLALKDKCFHPATHENYVKSYGGGKDNSPERLQGGLTHAFVSEFRNEEDRQYYLEKDPAHLEFVASLEGMIENVRVLDFEPNVL